MVSSWLQARSCLRRLPAATHLAVIGAALGVAGATLVATGDHFARPGAYGLFIANLVIGQFLVAFYWLRQRPGDRTGLLLLALGFVNLGKALQGASSGLLYTVGVLFESLVVVVGVALLMGFRSGAGVLAWLAVAGILILFTLALTWIAVIPGLTAKSVDGASAFSYPLIFLPFISSAFVPTDTMPGPVRAFAEHQPVTSIVNAIRDLFTQQPVGTDIWIALAWCVAILIVAYIFAMVIYRRRIS